MSSELILYQTEDGQTKIQTRLENETVWLTQAQMIELFGKAKSTISEHLKNIFEEGELDGNSVVRNFRITAADGKDYQTNHYNLDVIINTNTSTLLRDYHTFSIPLVYLPIPLLYPNYTPRVWKRYRIGMKKVKPANSSSVAIPNKGQTRYERW